MICHGLVSVLHLNGSLEEVRDFHKDSTGYVVRCAVHFDKSQKSASGKPENLQVIFKFPSDKFLKCIW